MYRYLILIYTAMLMEYNLDTETYKERDDVDTAARVRKLDRRSLITTANLRANEYDGSLWFYSSNAMYKKL